MGETPQTGTSLHSMQDALSAALDRVAALERSLADKGAVPVFFLESLDRLNQAIREAEDLDRMMGDVLDVVLEVMDADRAWLFYPCDPTAKYWQVPMERFRPEYPGALALGKDMPMVEEVRDVCAMAMFTDDPVPFGPGTERPLPLEVNKPFHVRSQLLMALYPKLDNPWLFGIHQCSRSRIWTPVEQMLFKAMGRRIGDALSSLLFLRGLRERERDLAASRKLMKSILDSLSSAIIGVDAGGLVTHFNRSALALVGKHAENVAGLPSREAFPVMRTLAETLEAALSGNTVAQVEKMPVQCNGEARLMDIQVFPLTATELGGAVVRLDDVTERVRLEELMVQTEKMMSVGGLAAGMAHEINNPLAGIVMNAQVVLRRMDKETPANLEAASKAGCTFEAVRGFLVARGVLEMVDSMRESAVRAAHIVSDMLAFSRKSESRQSMAAVSTLLDKAVELCATDYDLARKYDFRHIAIVREYQADMPTVPCSVTQIEQVFINLLRNAAQAMGKRPEGSGPPVITLRVFRAGDMARIEMEDNGLGMEEAVRRKIFEPFFSTKVPGEGTGLGLSVSYFIITSSHGGTISVESTLGRGTKFIIELPLAVSSS